MGRTVTLWWIGSQSVKRSMINIYLAVSKRKFLWGDIWILLPTVVGEKVDTKMSVTPCKALVNRRARPLGQMARECELAEVCLGCLRRSAWRWWWGRWFCHFSWWGSLFYYCRQREKNDSFDDRHYWHQLIHHLAKGGDHLGAQTTTWRKTPPDIHLRRMIFGIRHEEFERFNAHLSRFRGDSSRFWGDS